MTAANDVRLQEENAHLMRENMALKEEVAVLKAERRQGWKRAEAYLSGQFAAEVADPIDVPPAWGRRLTPNELSAMTILVKRHPNVISTLDILGAMKPLAATGHRGEGVARVAISEIRHKLGKTVIETVHGYGYRCSDSFKALTEQAP